MDFDKMPRFKMNALQITCKVSEWSEIFKVEPSEIERQIELAYGWMVNNPRRAPKSDVMRYLYNWMLIADRKLSMRKRPVDNFKEVRPPEDEILTGEDFARMRQAI